MYPFCGKCRLATCRAGYQNIKSFLHGNYHFDFQFDYSLDFSTTVLIFELDVNTIYFFSLMVYIISIVIYIMNIRSKLLLIQRTLFTLAKYTKKRRYHDV